MNRKRTIAIIAPILVAIIVIVPLVYEGYFDPIVDRYIPISVRDGHENVTYSRDFNSVSSTDLFYFSPNQAVSVVVLASHPDSYLNLDARNGYVYYFPPPDNLSTINFIFSVSGHFAGLHPYSMTIFFAALGPNQSSVVLTPGGGPQKCQNVSPELGYFRLEGPGKVSLLVPLLNESNTLPFYNFSLNFCAQILVNMVPGSSHLFEIGAQVNDLSKPVISTVNMTMVEKG